MINIRKIVKTLIPKKIFKKIEPFGHLVESVIMNLAYGLPSRGLHIIGVTGTNGKTTTTFLIHRMMHEAGYKVGMFSTVAYGVGDDIKNQIQHMTTEKAGVLQKRLRDFKRAGVQWVIVETSSHSLAQYRNWGLKYEIVVMTNVTNDHLDYHETFENYLDAKLRLFKIAAKLKNGFGIVNADDPNAKIFTDAIKTSVTYGIKSGDLRANDIKLTVDHLVYSAKIENEEYKIKVNMPGQFNVSNSLAAIAVGRRLGLNKKQIEDGIVKLSGVEGRMTVVDEGQKFKVIIDHASTPDAFQNFFDNVKPFVGGKLIAVFGSAGRRDEAKRAVQGEIAGKFCDEVILTEEDDRDIDGNMILEQIASGAEKAGKVKDKDMFLILDRGKAIEFAMTRAKNADDAVVLLGKGHEKTIERADGEHPWREIIVAQKAIKKVLGQN